jgi:hypothetical protein
VSSTRPFSTAIVNLYNEGYDVYVGSPRDGLDPREVQPGDYGFLGNPFADMADSDEAIAAYRDYFLDRVRNDRRFRLAVLAIRGKRLGCFCEEGERCHAEAIAEWLEGQRKAHASLIGANLS